MQKIKTGITRPKLLYIGDLPGFAVNGVTSSFAINLKMLSDAAELVHIPEELGLSENVFRRTTKTIRSFKRILLHFSKDKPDIVYLNYPLSLFGSIKTWIILVIVEKYNTKAILHIHRGDFYSEYASRALNSWLANRIFSCANKVIVLSDLFRERLQKEFKGQFYTLQNCISDEPVTIHKKQEKYDFIFVSNYLETKGINLLLKVFDELERELPSEHLSCFGFFPNETQKRRLSSYSNHRISINNAVLGTEKFEIIRNSTCLILPSFNEGQPLILLEAMSVGTPVIASRVGFVEEMLGSDYPFLIKAGDKTSLKNAILRFSSIPDHSALSRKLLKTYHDQFSQAKHKKELFRIFGLLV